MANRKLSAYRSKRDFRVTEEPSGEAAPRASEHLRFVIQKHDASRLHYDLRLELDGVFKSWAVTRGPSLNPRDKRLAVEVEDHPLEYGDFEGTIPKGQYGGGTVQLWDRGYWVPEGDKTPEKMLADGDLKFALKGDRLRGSWALVRMRSDRTDGKRKNWLLIKHRDAIARDANGDALLAEDRSVASGRTMAAIAAGNGPPPTPFINDAERDPGSRDSDTQRRDAGLGDRGTHPRDAGLRDGSTKPRAAGVRNRTTKSRAAGVRNRTTKSRDAGVHDPVVMGVSISKPEKELWPGTDRSTGVTKLALARYYEAVGAWMMRHLKGRPCGIVRAPDGIHGPQFFQRHSAGTESPGLQQVQVDDGEPYLQIDAVEGLVALAQAAGVELHPWNCQPGLPLVPGRLVFDLDPGPGVPFTDVVTAALEVRERLLQVGLEALCKTTGGKGLHVVSPLAPSRQAPSWPDAKEFARELCLRMAADSPARYVVNMAKAKRASRIYLDYLRNDRTATAVAPLSPRARDGAPVSMPLNWSQVRKTLDPARYTLNSAAALLQSSGAWDAYRELERPLAAAVKRLKKALSSA